VTDDQTIRERIESMVEEEQQLLRDAEGAGPDDSRHARLDELRVELDRCWDLLRQRHGREEFGLDPEVVHARDADTVEDYEQ
jgi:Protein of unknown function (DUF2630)